jgi:hypothetical protein
LEESKELFTKTDWVESTQCTGFTAKATELRRWRATQTRPHSFTSGAAEHEPQASWPVQAIQAGAQANGTITHFVSNTADALFEMHFAETTKAAEKKQAKLIISFSSSYLSLFL